MRKITISFLALLITLTLSMPNTAQAQIPPKAKAFLTITAYGAGGGALLGAASMAFGTSTRAVAQGASLGLYAGILFGTYVLVSHHQRRYGTYDDNSSPYRESSDIYGDEYNPSGAGGEGEGSGFFNRIQTISDKVHRQAFTFDSQKRKGGQMPPLQINFLNLEF